MNGKKKQKIKLERSVIIMLYAILFAAAVIVAQIIYMFSTNDMVAEQNMEYIEKTTHQTAAHVEEMLQDGHAGIEAFAELYGASLTSPTPDLTRLKKFSEKTLFDHIEYADADGMDTAMDGEKKEVSHSEYFRRGMQGESGISVIFPSKASDETQTLFYAPLRYQEEIVGVLLGHYSIEHMRDVLSFTYMGENSMSYLCGDDGTIIASSVDAAGKIQEILKDSRMTEDSQSGFADAMKKHHSYGSTFEDGVGTANAYVAPLKQNGWSLVQIFPSSMTAKLSNWIMVSGMLPMVILSVVFLVFLIVQGIFSFRKSEQLAQEKREMEHIIEAVNSLFTRFILVDLVHDTYRCLEDNSDLPLTIPKEGAYHDFVACFEKRFLELNGSDEAGRILSKEYIQENMPEDVSVLRFECLIDRLVENRWEDLAFLCIEREEGIVTRLLFAIQNVDKLKQEEFAKRQALETAFQAAEAANHAKTDFLNQMSHDIRTPMNGIMGMTRIARMYQDDSEKVEDCLNKIEISGEHLLGLINEVLDLSKIESEKFVLKEEELHLSSLIDSLVSMFQPQAEVKGITFNYENVELKHDGVIGDRQRMQQIFVNILGNAVKFTPSGGRITMSVKEKSSSVTGRGSYEFIFRDTGIGMSEEFQKHIFEPFVRARDSRTEKTEGAGLGMASAHNLIQLMNGTIQVESAPGMGSCFTVMLFLKLSEEAEEELPETVEENGVKDEEQEMSFRGKRLLLVEDNELNREIAEELLGVYGFRIETACDGKEAVDMIFASRENYYDMVLMDIQMPNMDGYEAARVIRASGREDLKKIPVIAMTADAFADDRLKAIAAGMDGHVSKPVDYEKLNCIFVKYFAD